ncbi:unnamed protein product [Musa acuminata subsp. malaccensis]|uniref:Exopolygalacturonase n=1 Tax=Musa acuminata subsp. malaccensis TaxID=214687 RepID=A0A804JWG4_MUSAM|nr:PREDICTED: exopolygalacturonase-like [Musa acuminata subsp. malaccensis]CAG1856924.1 unnamed protein product [Musa acuminata subsp. malaccensis]
MPSRYWTAFFTILVVFLCSSSDACKAGQSKCRVFDVTRFGAVRGSQDNSQAFLAAWSAACRFKGKATFVVPKGTFKLSPVQFKGPCYDGASPSVKIRGVLQALPGSSDDNYWIKFSDLNRLSVGGGGEIDGQGADSWSGNKCNKECKLSSTTLKFDRVRDSRVARLSLLNSKAFHIKFHRCDNIDVYGLKISAPWNSRNTDGIHIAVTNGITIRSSIIGTGDDCISVGQGSRNVTISNIICGPGHGISVGSLGRYENEMDVVGLVVKNCTIMHTANGLRIKTWPGSSKSRASGLLFEDINMIDVSNPIFIDQKYCPGNDCSSEPSKVQINDVKFRRIKGTSLTKLAVNLLCSSDAPCSNVELDDIRLECSAGGECRTTSSCTNVKANFSGVQIPSPCL